MYSFRFASLDDVDNIVALVESAYRGDASRKGWTTEADLLSGQRTDNDEVSRLIAESSSYILLCENQAELLGSVHLINDSESAYLGMFAVNPCQQSKGIGSLLLAEAEKYVFQQWQCLSLKMSVISLREELIAWYQRRGFTVTGETLAFPYGDERYGIPERDDLEFCVLKKHEFYS
ncbi:MAG: GNAT family N-acetyltransferase [Gammaproteobacteria bacterium]|nr:GNAT family N-acetyltransferase [Gammaproteobacteria bacterium]